MTHSQATRKDSHRKDHSCLKEAQSMMVKYKSWSRTFRSIYCKDVSNKSLSTMRSSCRIWLGLYSQSLWPTQWCGRRATHSDRSHSELFLPFSINWHSIGSVCPRPWRVQKRTLCSGLIGPQLKTYWLLLTLALPESDPQLTRFCPKSMDQIRTKSGMRELCKWSMKNSMQLRDRWAVKFKTWVTLRRSLRTNLSWYQPSLSMMTSPTQEANTRQRVKLPKPSKQLAASQETCQML